MILLCFARRQDLFSVGLFNLQVFICARVSMFLLVSAIYVSTGNLLLVVQIRSFILLLIMQLVCLLFVIMFGIAFAVSLILLLI